MPSPKKKDTKSERGQQKALEREKQKIIEDKTFGLKNKNKSKAVQKFIKSVQQQAKGPQKGGEAHEIAKKKEEQQMKKAQMQQQMLLQALFKGTENVKKMAAESNVGTYDPKESKMEQKIDLYVDQREQNGSGFAEGADLETAIVCKFFLEAVERKQYGWFWVCPNGGDACKYRHCLPQGTEPSRFAGFTLRLTGGAVLIEACIMEAALGTARATGYVLKGEDEMDVVEEEEEPIEEVVERQRQELPPGGTPVTAETFAAWKAKKEAERFAALEKQQRELRKAARGGTTGAPGGAASSLSGKDLFSFDPSLFVDVDGAADECDYEEDGDWAEEVRKIQEAVDEAHATAQAAAHQDNEEARAECEESDAAEEQTKADDTKTDKSKNKQQSDANPIKKELFLDDIAPDELDALDD
ncbi:hypothetical protein ACSSS7_005389 [Eimeria intestinalis]